MSKNNDELEGKYKQALESAKVFKDICSEYVNSLGYGKAYLRCVDILQDPSRIERVRLEKVTCGVPTDNPLEDLLDVAIKTIKIDLNGHLFTTSSEGVNFPCLKFTPEQHYTCAWMRLNGQTLDEISRVTKLSISSVRLMCKGPK